MVVCLGRLLSPLQQTAVEARRLGKGKGEERNASYADQPGTLHSKPRLAGRMLPKSLAVVNANDVLPTNADGSLPLVPNSDLFYLTGIEQEQTVLTSLFRRRPTNGSAKFSSSASRSRNSKLWEGHKHTKEEAQQISGVKTIKWLHEFPKIFRGLMCEAQQVYLNSNEHKAGSRRRADARLPICLPECRRQYPLHDYQRLARLMQSLRLVKSRRRVRPAQAGDRDHGAKAFAACSRSLSGRE